MTIWDKRFFDIAKQVASWSKDPNAKVGAILVSPDRRHMSIGYNGFPKGIADRPDRLKNQTVKNNLTVHAELNAILNAGVSVDGWTLYCTKAPCTECCKAIIQAGIQRIVTMPIKDESDWAKACWFGRHLLTEAGVQVDEVHSSD